MKKPIFCSALGTIALFLLSLMSLPGQPSPSSANFLQPYTLAAEELLATMTTDQKLSQILLVRYPNSNGRAELAQYQFGGYLFFAKDFAGKDPVAVQAMISQLQQVAQIPILTAVDEEGGSVVRVSSNPKLAPSKFPSPRSLYQQGGLTAIREDTVQKSQLLANLGLNLNLAPVVDVSTHPDDFMYDRSLGENTELTAEYARTVITASQGTGVSYTLKHFPGYGNNVDTHLGSATDQRSYQEIVERDLPPFQAGIDAGAEAVLVSHNIVSSIDPDHPASLSPALHELLRHDLGFRGVILTDDLAMGAVAGQSDVATQALLAGNDLLITTDYQQAIADLRAALADGRLTMAQLDRAVLKVLKWKFHKGLLPR